MTIPRLKRATQYIGAIAVLSLIAVFQATAADKPAGKKAAPAKSTASVNASLKVSVSLSPELVSKAKPDDVVFIFARAVQGPRMPLAVARKLVKDLPMTVTLDDSLSMTPEMKISSVPEVIVVARVSKSGLATSQAGDLEGISEPVKLGTKAITLSINKEVAAP